MAGAQQSKALFWATGRASQWERQAQRERGARRDPRSPSHSSTLRLETWTRKHTKLFHIKPFSLFGNEMSSLYFFLQDSLSHFCTSILRKKKKEWVIVKQSSGTLQFPLPTKRWDGRASLNCTLRWKLPKRFILECWNPPYEFKNLLRDWKQIWRARRKISPLVD